MKSLSEIYAKSKNEKKGIPAETLEKHTGNAVEVWKVLYHRYKDSLSLDNEFWVRSLIAVIFHDFGKATRNFQNT